jgi:hypothetical protein
MNSLELHLHAKKLNEIETMNALQDAAIVSDLCVLACDVAEVDSTAAIAFLAFRGIEPKPKAKPAGKQREMQFVRQPYPD